VTDGAVLVDTSAWLLAVGSRRIPQYAKALADARPAIVPGLVLAEMDWHLRTRRVPMHAILRDIAREAYQYEPPTIADLNRAREIDAKFSDLKLGLTDASIAALSERLGVQRILTTDSDFLALRVGTRWNIGFELVVPLLHGQSARGRSR
jgi:predicted nucleic acid-binding protein